MRHDGTRPFLTWYDDATDDRVELSVATAANWAAKIANHLVDEDDLQPGDAVAVEPALHWITAVLLLGGWTAGGHVRLSGRPSLDVDRDPMGIGLSRLVGGQPDQYVGPPVDATAPALTVGDRTWTHAQLAADAGDAAAHHGITGASRVLSTLGYDSVDGLDTGLLVPLAGGASVVLVGHADAGGLPAR